MGQVLGHTISLEVIRNAEPVQRSSNANVSVIGDDRPIHRDFHFLALLFELPAVLSAVHLEPPVNARMPLLFVEYEGYVRVTVVGSHERPNVHL